MTKYVVAILVGVAALAGLIIFIGETSQLLLTSTSPRAFLTFEVQLSWRFVIVALTVLLILLFALWSFIGWLIRLPGQLRSGVGRRRRNQALEAMEEALIAGAEGDQAKARKRAERARGLIKNAALGRMISAYSADASGDSEDAIAHYTAMLEDARTRTTGQRGLAQHFLNRGDVAGAIDHAQQAYTDNKKAGWAFDVLFQAQLSDYRWSEALETLAQGEARKHVDKDVARRRKAVLLTAEATRLLGEDQAGAALETALMAVAQSSHFAPAVALAALRLNADGNRKKAVNIIEKAWAQTPHPALALALRDIFAGDTEKVWNTRVKALIKLNPGHRETVIFQAEEALRAGDGVRAWSGLSPLLKDDAVSARLCVLAAKAEQMLDNPADARMWMEKAATAAAEPDWSDLDPEGDAFEYSDPDWRRLVFSFGETGELIHPRFEAGAPRRAILKDMASSAAVTADTIPDDTLSIQDEQTPVVEETDAPTDKTLSEMDARALRQPDDPGAESARDTDDLAERLDSLLDDPGDKS